MKLRILMGLAAILTASTAGAFPDVCTMANSEITGIRATADQIASYKAKLATECALSEKYQQMTNKARAKFGISLEQIAQYQAMRYIRRADYTSAKMSGVPVAVIYQIHKEDYLKSNENKSSAIWDGFVTGVSRLAAERERLAGGARFEFNDLLRIQKGYYQVSDEVGDYAQAPEPGTIRQPAPNDSQWMKVEPSAVDRTKATIDDINEAYGDMDLLATGLAGLYEDTYMGQILSVKPARDGSGMAVYGGDSRGSEAHILTLLKFVNAMLAQARQYQHMVWKGRLMTPGELAFLSQQYLAQARPFFEGNERTSRFIQELLLTSFGLPQGSSGDLMDDDAMTLNAAYYDRGISKTRELLASVDECLEKTYPQAAAGGGRSAKGESRKGENRNGSTPINIASLNQTAIEYDCRIIK